MTEDLVLSDEDVLETDSVDITGTESIDIDDDCVLAVTTAY